MTDSHASHRRRLRSGDVLLVVLGGLVSVVLAGCTASPTLEGVWHPEDGGVDKVIDAAGNCSGMYYNQGRVLDIGGPATCALGSTSEDGSYALVVRQPPNQVTYRVRFDGDTMRFTSGGREIVLTRD